VRSLLLVVSFAWLAGLAGCRILTSGLFGEAGTTEARSDAVAAVDWPPLDTQPAIDLNEPPGVYGPGYSAGCSDSTREGFRDYQNWPEIAGCAGAFDRAGVLQDLQPTCGRHAGNTGSQADGKGCSAADLCTPDWHVCRNGDDVAKHSPTGDCEGCVLAGETRFFLVASGASPMGICSPDPQAANDLHGCGGLGQPEDQSCAPLSRRMGFADCLATNGVWNCGGQKDNSDEASKVTKTGTPLGGVLCCMD
jgi:hypothetical protein